MPKMGMAQETGTLLQWLKKEGEWVNEGEPLFEVMTDKVNMQVEAPASGYLKGIRAHPNDVVPVTEVIAYIVAEGEEVEAAPRPAEVAAPSEEAARAEAPSRVTAPAPTIEARGPVRATPVARKMAQEFGLDLSRIRGTGPGGIIVQADVLAARAAPQPAGRPGRRVPLVGRRRIIAERMLRSAQQAPHIALTIEVDMSHAERTRGEASFTAVLVAKVAPLLVKHPFMNATLEGEEIVLLDEVNVGVAVAAEEGLIVPVVKAAHRKSLAQIDAEIRDLARRAREGKLTLDDVTGGTFTISNLGMFGIEEFRAIINPPESAILAVGAIIRKPVVIGDGIAIRPMMKITASADHRIVDGAVVAEFLRDLKADLEGQPSNAGT